MKYFKRTLICICFFTAFFMLTNVNASGEPLLQTPSIILDDGTKYSIDLVDKDRENEKLIIYTRNYGEFTKPFSGDTHEFVVVNSIVVTKGFNGATGTYIPSNGCVISYTGKNQEVIEKLTIGRELSFSNINVQVMPDMYFKLDDLIVPIDSVNTLRDAGKTVLYNSSYGEATKTNSWGIELTVVNNVIAGIADPQKNKEEKPENNSVIPKDGIVLSIHSGSPYYKQVIEKAKLGAIIFITDDSSRLYTAAKAAFAAYNPKTIEDNPLAWDSTEGKPYDSFRGPDQLIIYDSSYGDSTGTNPYGYEVAVNSKGIIIAAGGNDSSIPEGGFVLSGHGAKLSWLQKNALLGAEVVLDSSKKTASVFITPEAYINRASLSIKSALESLEQAGNQYLDIPYDDIQDRLTAASAKLENLKQQMENRQFDGLTDMVKEIRKAADTAYYMTFESKRAEIRAVWLRPRETSVDEVIKKLDMLRELNINTIYLETYFSGYAIYPTNNELMPHNPIFKGFDVLDAYVREAHARGIELHAWVENFLVDLPVAEKKPEWMAVSKKGDIYYLENSRTRYYFLNPAIQEVRDYLSELYIALTKKYDLDGLQLDYIRYSHSGDYTNDFGYDTYTRQLFESFTGIDPMTLKPDSELWQKWCEFRAYLISSYAYRVISELKSIKPELKISADVWPDYDKTIADIHQDPKSWVSRDYINALIPMSYYLNESPVVEDIVNTRAFSRGHAQVISGIATYTKVDASVFMKQITAIRAANINGIAIFEFDSLFRGGYDSPLKLGAYSTPAVVPDSDSESSVKLLLREIIRKIDEIYIRYNGMTLEQGERYKKLMEGIKAELSASENKLVAAYSLRDNIYRLLDIISEDLLLNGEISRRMGEDLYNSINIMDAYISSLRFLEGRQVVKFTAELPFRVSDSRKRIPLKVKAAFSDGAAMYLDESQYSAQYDYPSSEKAETAITIEILDSFKYSRAADVAAKFAVEINNDKKGILKIDKIGYSGVSLTWESTVADSAVVGYGVYRNGTEIARTTSSSYTDRELGLGEDYIYRVYGFDAAGNLIYESSPAAVRTKGPQLLTSRQ